MQKGVVRKRYALTSVNDNDGSDVHEAISRY